VSRVGKRDVFVDLCTQRDYLSPAGARPAVNANEVITNLRHLMAFARWAHVPTLSCMELRRPDEVRGVPRAECVLGTPGQEKMRCTLLPQRVLVESDNRVCVALDLLDSCQQAIFIKRHRDPFTNPKLDRLLTEMPARRFVVFGVALEVSLRLLALGLLLRKRRVVLVHDACAFWNAGEADMALRQLAAKNCTMMSTHELISSSLVRRRPSSNGNGNGRRSVA